MTETGPRAIGNREVDQEIVFAWEIKGLLFTCTITRSSCRAITSLISAEEVNKLVVSELVSDACRVLSEVQREESLTRKALVLTNVNSSLKETLNTTTIGEMLFGKELEGQIKIAKTLERTSKELKSSDKTSKSTKNGQRPSRAVTTASKIQTKPDGQRRSWNLRNTYPKSTYQKNAYQRTNASTSSTRRRHLLRKQSINPIVLTWISGYEIPFSQLPRQNSTPTESKWSLEELREIPGLISKLLMKG
ncbi:hypothetical protein KQX54_014774, partial [Cotesia glomerata]